MVVAPYTRINPGFSTQIINGMQLNSEMYGIKKAPDTDLNQLKNEIK